MPEPRSARDFLLRWKAGEQSAAREIYRRYSQRLYSLVEKRIDRRLGRRFGPEDVTQCAFRSFFRRATDGQFQVDNSSELWGLLVAITLHKVYHTVERERAKKRNPAFEAYLDDDTSPPQVIAQGPGPEEAAALEDEFEHLFSLLDQSEAEILRLTLEGQSTPEIAAAMGCARQTVRRKLNRMGELLQARLRDRPEG